MSSSFWGIGFFHQPAGGFLGYGVGYPGNLPYKNGGEYRALPHAIEPMQENGGQNDRQTHQRDIKGGFHRAEPHRCHLAHGQHYTFSGSGDQFGGYFDTDTHSYQHDTQHT